MPETTDMLSEKFVEPTDEVSKEPPNNVGGSEGEQRILEIQSELADLRKQDCLSALRKGELLTEAKTIFGEHGKWGPWLKKVGISTYLAQRYMKVFRVFGNRTPEFDLTYSKALVLTLLPENEIDKFLQEEHDVGGGKRKKVEEMTKRELDKAVHDCLGEKAKSKSKTSTMEVIESASADGFDKHLEAAKIAVDSLLSLTSSEKDDDARQIQVMELRELCKRIIEQIPDADPEEE